MKATTPTPNEYPPLARDAQGHHLPIPDGTCAWRICRHTKGRPRVINGPDKQPARFPLDTTAEELADACGADSYRVYALDDVGNVIDYVTTVETSRELRNAAEPEVTVMPAIRSSGSSDLRYALEAVAHMARTNADAMRAVAESQAEWIKAISTARGFFRNAPPPQLVKPANEPDEDDDEDELDREPDWIEQLQPIIGVVVQQLVEKLMGPKQVSAGPSKKLELADMLDWRRAAAKHETSQIASTEATLDPLALQQALAGKAMAIGALLEPDERARLMKLAPMLSKLAGDPEISKMLSELVAMSVEDSAAWVRAHLDEIEKGLAS
jgi:hypothetical protein